MNRLVPTALAVLLVLLYVPLQAQKVFDYNDRCKQAYHEIIQLKLNSGQQLLNTEKAQHPNNLIPYFLENYIDFFTLFFNEDPAEFKSGCLTPTTASICWMKDRRIPPSCYLPVR